MLGGFRGQSVKSPLQLSRARIERKYGVVVVVVAGSPLGGLFGMAASVHG
jgi:hypothetical protein